MSLYFTNLLERGVIFSILFFVITKRFKVRGRYEIFFIIFKNLLFSIVKLKHKNHKILYFFLFVIISFLNSLRIFSFTFRYCRSPRLIIFLTLNCYFMVIFINYQKNWKLVVSHLVPKSSPLGLNVFLIFIELIGIFIKPLTLIFRMLANVTVGHLILHFVRNLFLINFFIVVLELLVGLAQRLRYSYLIRVYINEISCKVKNLLQIGLY